MATTGQRRDNAQERVARDDGKAPIRRSGRVGTTRKVSPRRQGRPARAPFRASQLLLPRLQLPLLLAATALALLFAWQVRQPLTLTLGGPDDAPYLTGFHEPEIAPDTGQPFRWTRDRSTIILPGFGATDAELRLHLQGSRPPGAPPLTATIGIGDMSPRAISLVAEPTVHTFPVPAAAFRDGGLTVSSASPTYRPAGDRRDLGVVATRVELRDAGGAVGLIAPPLRTLGVALLAALCAYGTVALALRSPLSGAVAGWATAAAFVTFALGPRSILTLYAPGLAPLIGIGTLVTLGVAAGLWWLRPRAGWEVSERALGGAALIAEANALALLIGMRHPQYRSSDLMLNVHRLEFVQRGEWIFTLALPGPRALEAPYPPLFYAAMLPFAAIIPDKALLVELCATLIIAVGALLTFALARRLTGADAPALWAAGIYAILPITYNLASAGNFANLFGQGVATIYLVALILTWGRWTRPAVAAALTIGLTLALLGHFGVFLSLGATLPLLVLALLVRGREGGPQALALLGSFLVALALSWALYYRFHDALLLGHLRDFLGGETNARGGAIAEASLAARFRSEGANLLLWWGWPALPLALAGANLLRRTLPSAPLTLALTWLATALPFFLAALVAGLSVRFQIFVGPALAAAGGWALWQIWRVHRLIGPLVALAIGGFWLWQSLAYWADRVLHAYH
ncbi:MAG: hypothetical protein AVDCRST_MAG18-1898 [uncultured Thermomicrobiales bacterium]|uniref:Uncharacterized protein n=1 Tax=uncultured Thermomicrobiales bacterium TaxID=1645740 RepID=A0A6J4V7B6_9BACT|nr:MAG: hypothetical protein AVDCRST_MAG18-1898 [uncultured Thermomicrobiales bacterium]